MKESKESALRFAVCVNNTDYPASLEIHKIYRVLPDKDAAADGDLRIVDESGEDYLYPADRFVPIAGPQVKDLTHKGESLATRFSGEGLDHNLNAAGCRSPSKFEGRD